MVHNSMSSFLVAAPKSNSGKTMVTLGLMHALVKRGFKVQPFKCGPDYIDPMHHTKIAGKSSYNLDLWMSSAEHVQDVFKKQSRDADVAIAEGVMGLFDGAKKDEGSSAAVARLLHMPVVLVVDASSTAYSVAPLLYGFKNFDTRIKLAGVIFNKVASESHFQFLKEASIDAGVDVLGYLPRDERLHIESRHLGLHLPGENKNLKIVGVAAELLEQKVDIDLLLSLSKREEMTIASTQDRAGGKLRIAMAHDEAFSFSYSANRDVLLQLGDVKEFSPLHDNALPEADLVWLPGGYPELFAQELSENGAMRRAIISYIDSGKALIAECGGMMYLGNKLIQKNGEAFEMCGVFDFDTSFEHMKLHLGYRELLGHSMAVRGHEFHYSRLIGKEKGSAEFQVKTARNKTAEMAVFREKNCWASYMHLYLGEKEKMQQLLNELGL
ncbi:cobyrinate a,c-diamide synthase [Saccharicrinis fermentans]|nr:cobyrinate a,c-diamide synthase [Saccharicrinis fermentans]